MEEKINWKLQFVELAVVIIGILIAFGLNSWNENRKDRLQAQSYLEGIREELESNKEALEKAHPYHQQLLKDLNEKPLEARLSLNPANVKNVAWNLAQNNVFKENIDATTYKDLAAAYQLHDFLQFQVKAAGERMSEVNVVSPYYMVGSGIEDFSEKKLEAFYIQVRKGWIPIFESWTSTEGIYLEEISKTLEKISRP